MRCLRPDLPPPTAFTVTELEHRAKLDQNEAPGDLPHELKREILVQIGNQFFLSFVRHSHSSCQSDIRLEPNIIP